MELGLKGKTVIVTGGASNIGRAVTLAFAREGANVVLADIDMAQAERVAGLAEAGAIHPVRCDVSDPAAGEALVHESRRKFGAPDVFVNNAGWCDDTLFLEKDWASAQKEVALNLWAPLYLTRAILPAMVERGHGRIVYVASDAGRIGEYKESVYSATKAGVMAFLKSVAREVGRHAITVNGVCPAMTLPQAGDEVGALSMHAGGRIPEDAVAKAVKKYALRRIGRPEDVANLVLFLGSDAASFITGQNISVNGGYVM